MTDKKEEPLSPAMTSALRPVTRMKGNSAIAGLAVLDEPMRDDRHSPKAQQEGRPVGR